MKPLTLVEVELVIETLQVLVGSQLQEIIPHDRGLALGFYDQRLSYLAIDLSPAHPGLFLFDSLPFWTKSLKPKPLSLFLNSHAKNLVLRKLALDKDQGRVVQIQLSNSTQVCDLQCILIPKQANLLAQSFEIDQPRKTLRKISWDKPRDLSPPPEDFEALAPRSFVEIHEQWLGTFGGAKKNKLDPQIEWEKRKTQQILKKTKALHEIEKEMHSDKADRWQALGELLKTEDLDSLPSEWADWVDPKLDLRGNRERAFQKSKQVKQKKLGQSQRIEILRNEIEILSTSVFSEAAERKQADKNKRNLIQGSAAAGRTRKLESGAVAYMGKSADDNLRILRAAKAWDYWLHLRDYPGAHAIIHREKNQIVPEAELQEIAFWVANETLSKKTLALGQKLNVILVECRFVRPIKGDRHGRVNYHDERNLVVSYEKK